MGLEQCYRNVATSSNKGSHLGIFQAKSVQVIILRLGLFPLFTIWSPCYEHNCKSSEKTGDNCGNKLLVFGCVVVYMSHAFPNASPFM